MPAPQSAIPSSLAAEWDRCAGGANPFLTRAFYDALFDSGSASSAAGWGFSPVVRREAANGGETARITAFAPVFRKTHSMGEYVFDHGWAGAWQRAGRRYYPKLFLGVPFTPVPGPRLLVGPDAPPTARADLAAGIEAAVAAEGLSSAHATFLEPADRDVLAARGWVLRAGYQFHFDNPGYPTFEAFLATLQSHRRKDIRRERRLAQASGLRLRTLRGEQLTPDVLAQFHTLYLANSDRKWGQPYLTASFWPRLVAGLGDAVILTVAQDGDRLVAAALHLRGADTLYGRNWGAARQVPFLHFELCYYMAIDLAIAEGVARVEAGAQGEHKLQRGYLPRLTWSAHHLPDPRFRAAVQQFCDDERAQIEAALAGEAGPFRAAAP